jgi:hypothetical protein
MTTSGHKTYAYAYTYGYQLILLIFPCAHPRERDEASFSLIPLTFGPLLVEIYVPLIHYCCSRLFSIRLYHQFVTPSYFIFFLNLNTVHFIGFLMTAPGLFIRASKNPGAQRWGWFDDWSLVPLCRKRQMTDYFLRPGGRSDEHDEIPIEFYWNHLTKFLGLESFHFWGFKGTQYHQGSNGKWSGLTFKLQSIKCQAIFAISTVIIDEYIIHIVMIINEGFLSTSRSTDLLMKWAREAIEDTSCGILLICCTEDPFSRPIREYSNSSSVSVRQMNKFWDQGLVCWMEFR